MPRSADPIQQALSEAIRAAREQGTITPGLTISKQGTRPRCKYQTPQHTKPETATLPITWSLANASTIIDQLEEVSKLMRSGYGLKVSVDSLRTIEADGSDLFPWASVYEKWVINQGYTVETAKKYDAWFKRMYQLLRDQNHPVVNGKALFRQYEAKYFAKVAPGSDGRVRPLRFFSNLIDYAIEHHALHSDWTVPQSFRLQIVGKKEKNSKSITPPVTTDQLLKLLGELEDKHPDIYTMVGLMSLYGLMPAELSVISLTADGLEIIKSRPSLLLPKNRAPRKLESIDPLERQGLGESIANRWHSGELSLPNSVQNAIARCYDAPFSVSSPNYKAVGDAVRQVLERNAFWDALVRVNPDITPYSLRHSFAWRCHRELGMETSMVAPWMGHSSVVHDKHYSAFFTHETQRRYKADMIRLASLKAQLASEDDGELSHDQED